MKRKYVVMLKEQGETVSECYVFDKLVDVFNTISSLTDDEDDSTPVWEVVVRPAYE